MSLLANSNAIESGGYNIDRSLRFRSSASAYLSRTFTTPTSGTTYTYSGWFKRGDLSSYGWLLTATAASPSSKTDWAYFYFDGPNGFLRIGDYNDYILTTSAVFRDPSAWYHIVMSVDTTQATATNRIKIYVNGVQYSYTQNASFPAQNEIMTFGKAVEHRIGRNSNSSDTHYFDGYATEVNFIDGQALTPSSFGETSTETGVWVPKKYTGTYGTNGFYLDFKDNTSATTLAYDKSGNGNNWTPNNISTTAGATYDSMTDVPTLTSATAANYCVLNPLDKAGAASITNANLSLTSSSVAWGAVRGSFAITSGKWYWEVNMVSVDPTTNGVCIGIANEAVLQTGYNMTGQWVYNNNSGGRKGLNGTSSAYGSAATTGDIVGVALDMDAGTLTFYRNNVSMGVAASSGLPTTAFPIHQTYYNDGIAINFGQRPFSYTPPTGFKALNTFNLPDPTIKKPNQYMDATTYTGTGSARSVINTGQFQPDLVWVKCRSVSYSHLLLDSVRGVSKRLISDTTAAEVTDTDTLTSFNSNGFSWGTGIGGNQNGATYVGWQWKKGATPGFDIVTYTGTGSARTVSHSLGVAPKMMIFKNRSNSGFNWATYHAAITNAQQYPVYLNLTDAAAINNAQFNNTAPTSSVFSVGASSDTNQNTALMVAYLFAEIAGFSKFGSYTGNGSADGPFVYCGFRPKFVMVKRTNDISDWLILDTSRNTYNVVLNKLFSNSSSAEIQSGSPLDVLSNGFKCRDTGTASNVSGSTYIYMAFASNPFKFSNAA